MLPPEAREQNELTNDKQKTDERTTPVHRSGAQKRQRMHTTAIANTRTQRLWLTHFRAFFAAGAPDSRSPHAPAPTAADASDVPSAMATMRGAAA